MSSAISAALGGDPASWPVGKASRLASSLKPLTRAERIRRFGVDCGDGLTWEAGWQPGGEYTKQLVVKNVSKHVVRLKYKLPESKFFSMAFPETIVLTAGLSAVLQARAAASSASATTLLGRRRLQAPQLRAALQRAVLRQLPEPDAG
jgi:hypothetical protein